MIMKVSLFHNDKSTNKDEIILGVITVIAAIVGIILITLKPSMGFVSEEVFVGFGIALLFLSIMYLPYLIYRLFHNDK